MMLFTAAIEGQIGLAKGGEGEVVLKSRFSRRLYFAEKSETLRKG